MQLEKGKENDYTFLVLGMFNYFAWSQLLHSILRKVWTWYFNHLTGEVHYRVDVDCIIFLTLLKYESEWFYLDEK